MTDRIKPTTERTWKNPKHFKKVFYNKTKGQGLLFNEWKELVDRLLRICTGMSCDDLPDQDYYMAWVSGHSVIEMVNLTIARINKGELL